MSSSCGARCDAPRPSRRQGLCRRCTPAEPRTRASRVPRVRRATCEPRTRTEGQLHEHAVAPAGAAAPARRAESDASGGACGGRARSTGAAHLRSEYASPSACGASLGHVGRRLQKRSTTQCMASHERAI
eukprot:5699675-Prymnesium_polylepis.1